MSLSSFALPLLLVLAVNSTAPTAGNVVGRGVLLLLACVSLPALAAWWGRQLNRGSGTVSASSGKRRAIAAAQRSIWACWLLLCLIAVSLLSWPTIIRSELDFADWVLVDELLIVLPMVAILWCSRAAFARFLCASEATQADWQTATRYELAVLLLPSLAALGLFELVDRSAPVWMAVLAAGLPLAALIALYPYAVAWAWRLEPVGNTNTLPRLESLVRRVGLQRVRFLQWPEGADSTAAAAVAGRPGCGTILLGDALVKHGHPDILAAIVAHEAAHLAHGHVWQRLAAVAAPIPLFATLWLLLPDDAELIRGGLCVFAAISLIYLLSRLAKLLEHEADVVAFRSIEGEDADDDPKRQDSTTALRTYTTALSAMAASPRQRRGGWLHPSIDQRMALLQQCARQSNAERELSAKLTRLRLVMTAIFMFGLLALPLAL